MPVVNFEPYLSGVDFSWANNRLCTSKWKYEHLEIDAARQLLLLIMQVTCRGWSAGSWVVAMPPLQLDLYRFSLCRQHMLASRHHLFVQAWISYRKHPHIICAFVQHLVDLLNHVINQETRALAVASTECVIEVSGPQSYCRHIHVLCDP